MSSANLPWARGSTLRGPSAWSAAGPAEWGINTKRIGMVGFPAGGRLALATATGFAKRTYEPIDAIDKVSCRPDFA